MITDLKQTHPKTCLPTCLAMMLGLNDPDAIPAFLTDEDWFEKYNNHLIKHYGVVKFTLPCDQESMFKVVDYMFQQHSKGGCMVSVTHKDSDETNPNTNHSVVIDFEQKMLKDPFRSNVVGIENIINCFNKQHNDFKYNVNNSGFYHISVLIKVTK